MDCNDNQILEYIQKIFDVKFDALDSKLDSINKTLSVNHVELKTKVENHEGRLTTLETRHRRDDKYSLVNDVKKEVVHWSIPTIIGLILLGIKSRLGL